ncbi:MULTISPECIES: stalk domain-containing protein [Paenibacillus]|uniref:Copper amine oxidase-like domain-containing protein n=1 Tax=Paenibacillus lactis 154 TaxID=743719 RepID=G4HMN1_9BACL|nr:stalk domain-containing protein [Paenibacillus lactis]EHB54441.1 copper amine oxidase-like domain-containing protein [Paenibacillus lactis 154]GIO93267.1 hypothetical protein J31TS3_44940 [Paenibacillus lactis]
MNKKLAAGAAILLMSAILACTPAPQQAQAADQIELLVDGEAAKAAGQPFYKGKTLYIPIRVLGEFYPYTFHWDNKRKIATLKSSDGASVFKAGSKLATAVGMGEVVLSGPVLLKNGHLYFPAYDLNTFTGAELVTNTSGRVDIRSGSMSTSVRVPTEPIAVAEENPKVKLYPALKDGDKYRGFILEAEGKRLRFNWEIPRFPNRPPQLFYADVNGDGKPEAVAVFVTGYGTGVYVQEIHVVSVKDGKEIKVTPPETAAEEVVASSIQLEGSELRIDLNLRGKSPKKLQLRMSDAFPDYSYRTEIGFGGVTYYRVEGNKLIASSAGDIGFAYYIGDFEFTYANGPDGLRPESVKLKNLIDEISVEGQDKPAGK